MVDREFTEFVADNVDEGRRRLVDISKTLVFRSDPELFDRLDFNDDATFLEPLVFSYFNLGDSPVSLRQILLGYVPNGHELHHLSVFSDAQGIVYLPNVGYFATDTPRAQLEMSRDGAKGSYALSSNGDPVEYRFEELLRVTETPIEVYRHSNPLVQRFFQDEMGRPVDVDSEVSTGKHFDHVVQAFRIISDVYPGYFDLMMYDTKRIAVFSSDHLNSFATISGHGIAFLNAPSDCDEVFFVEDLLHQCGHTICSAMTMNRADYFRIDPETNLATVTGQAVESRTVYVTFHGLFTEAAMVQCLDGCYAQDVFTGRQRHELLGRLAFILTKFQYDLASLAHEQIFTEKGLRAYQHFYRVFQQAYRDRFDLLRNLDLSEQPYNFSYKTFEERNPL